ncbi:MAG: Citrate synthase [Candidatus Woesebacteria bacterium GW2011_GWB1_39_10]|uniref:citrate synthase (unknown stereospecificity) n=2 Tax=Candidatus Woeseibacteriota TaxID=1752722 RepID=A0A0G0LMF1_9BACT|nr:MAG: Citrate synthase [Candidatus Woesebacteria bacterium GW2011_GWB1_39_10]KKS91177.1 MAG: Citrate synthase [Candidatus Woesebacteria bacterium GW2011_GWA1_43_12]
MTKTIVHKNNLPYFGNENLLEIAPKRSFAGMIFELLSGKEADSHQLKVFETILNTSIDHGEETPSATETIRAAKDGKTISESVAAGILQINDTHGGAIEPAMAMFYEIRNSKHEIRNFVKEQLEQGKRLSGFGHRIYEVDPRSQLLFKLAKDEGISDEYINLARDIERELLEQKGKVLPVNIDGAIAAILCAFGWEPKLGKAVFIIARTPGLCGQFLNSSK